MTHDRFGPTVTVEMTKEDLLDAKSAAVNYAWRMEDEGKTEYAKDIKYVADLFEEALDDIEEEA